MKTSSDFLNRYPIFEGAKTIEVLDEIIANAYSDLPTSTWTNEEKRDRAAMLITAHILQIERNDAMRQGIVMTVLQEKVNLDYKSLMNSCEYWCQTIYGTEFLQTRQSAVQPVMFVIGAI